MKTDHAEGHRPKVPCDESRTDGGPAAVPTRLGPGRESRKAPLAGSSQPAGRSDGGFESQRGRGRRGCLGSPPPRGPATARARVTGEVPARGSRQEASPELGEALEPQGSAGEGLRSG